MKHRIETTKTVFEEFSRRFPELYPDVPLKLICCDENLERLGFCEDAPYIFEIEASVDRYSNIMDDLVQLEIDAYHTENGESPSGDDPWYVCYIRSPPMRPS